MARGRKSEHVKILTGRDVKLLRQLDRTGIAASDQANIYCQLTPNRLKQLEKSGYIRTQNMAVNGMNTNIIRLDKVGTKFCKDTYDTKYVYHAALNHLEHDLRLTEAYYNLPGEVQETWKHETELLKEIYSRHQELKPGSIKTCVDATVQTGNTIIAIECRGDSYTNADIAEKQDIAINLLECSKMEVV